MNASISLLIIHFLTSSNIFGINPNLIVKDWFVVVFSDCYTMLIFLFVRWGMKI